MDTVHILCTLRSVKSFLGVFPSDLLPPHTIKRCGTIIINTDPHTESGAQWLALRLDSRSSHPYYFDSYGIPPFLPSIQAFLRRNCTVCVYNSVQLQGLTSTVCGKYCCLFALYVDRGYAPKQFAALFTPPLQTVRSTSCSRRNSGHSGIYREGASTSPDYINGKYTDSISIMKKAWVVPLTEIVINLSLIFFALAALIL
jgi:hypothetical protein